VEQALSTVFEFIELVFDEFEREFFEHVFDDLVSEFVLSDFGLAHVACLAPLGPGLRPTLAATALHFFGHRLLFYRPALL